MGVCFIRGALRILMSAPLLGIGSMLKTLIILLEIKPQIEKNMVIIKQIYF